MKNVTIDLDELASLVEEADQIFLSPEGEIALLKLLTLQDVVEQALEDAKAKLAEAGQRISPNFKSIHGDKVIVTYQAGGPRFGVDEAHLDQLPAELYKKKVTLQPIPAAIEEWADGHNGVLPLGIIDRERPKSIHIKLRKGEEV